MEYPHNLHPALVPGVSVEDRRIRYRIDRPILFTVGFSIITFVTWGVSAPENAYRTSSHLLAWTMNNLGWIFNLLASSMLLFLLVLAFSRFGRIPLGLEGEETEYSTVSWVAMLFGAGIGIGIIFFGTLEPLTHYFTPLPGIYQPATQEAVKGALAQSALHWGLNAWAIYAVVGLAVAYVSYRKGRVPLMSSILTPLFGGNSKSPSSRIIDSLAIIATLFGTAASLGIGALQITYAFKRFTGWSAAGISTAVCIVVLLTIGTIISAVSGVAKGIRRLSNINMVLTVVLAVFIFIAGPTLFLVNLIPGVVIKYFSTMPAMLSATMADGEQTQQFLSNWTTFYWAWWVSWAPFVGVFTAKISRGRSIRKFIFGVLFIPSVIIILAFSIFGGTALWFQRHEQPIVPDNNPANMPPAEEVFFLVLDRMDTTGIMAVLVMVLLAIFFITSADSAALVNSQLSQGGNPNPNRWVTGFWAVCMAGIAIVMLLMGGKNALQGLQNLITITALPFSLILILMCVALVKELRRDPLIIRDYYERTAIAQAVRYGIENYGDNFELSIEAVAPESDRGVGQSFDSTADEFTEWYVRTDEDGNPVKYNYETGEYIDE